MSLTRDLQEISFDISVSRRAASSTSDSVMEEGLMRLTRPIFCTNPRERVYITAWGCEIGSGRRNGLQAPGAGGL